MRRMQEAIGACRDEIKGAAILWVVLFSRAAGPWRAFVRCAEDRLRRGGHVSVPVRIWSLPLAEPGRGRGAIPPAPARRLLPAYLPFCVVWLCVMLPLYGLGTVQSVRVAAGNLLMLGFFAGTPAMINWYVSALALTLMLAPLVYGLMARASHPRRCAVLVAAACFAGGLCFIGTEAYMAVSRLPVFVLGMAAAVSAREEGTGGAYALALASGACGLAALYGCFARFPETLEFLRHVLAPLRADRACAVRGAGLAVFQGGAGLGGVCAASCAGTGLV